MSARLDGPPVPPVLPVPAAGGRRWGLVTIALAVALVNGAAGVIGHDSAAGQSIVAAAAPAAALSGRVVPRGNGSPSPVPVGLDGCDYNYVAAATGRRVCVPRTPPPGRQIDCGYLREQGIGSVRVVGQDTRRLAGVAPAAARGTVLCGS